MNLAIASGLFTDGFNKDYGLIRNFLDETSMDGIEMILYGDYDLKVIPDNMVYGHHLLYWPNWIDFWLGNKERLIEDFMTLDNAHYYYGFKEPSDMVGYLKKEFSIAKELGVDYMVMHVSNSSFREIFTFDHHYDDDQVLSHSAELINQVFDDNSGPMLLFENLWWPGLNYLDIQKTRKFLDSIEYANKGLVLDITHLLSTNAKIDNEDDAFDYLNETLDKMGSLVDHIKVIHLSKTIAGPYLRKDMSESMEAYDQAGELMDRFKLIYPHIHEIDSHSPFDDTRINEIIARIEPDYLVYELKASTVDELRSKILHQQKFISE